MRYALGLARIGRRASPRYSVLSLALGGLLQIYVSLCVQVITSGCAVIQDLFASAS
jgi:hypothetical protein